jgi:hypothetical protein
MLKKTWPLVVLVPLVLLALPLFVAGQAHDGVLVNPGFEEGFTVREAPEVEVANGWNYAYISGNDRWCPSPCNRPEAKPEQAIVSQGAYSQRWFSTFSRHLWAIFQSVSVEPGEWYSFSCDVQARTSIPPGDLGIFVGINPWNGGPFDRTTVWGKESVGDSGWIYNRWVRVSVMAQAYGNRINVIAASNPRWATRENTVYVDNCSISRVAGPTGPTPTPAPTWTPYPTPAPCPTCAPGTGGCDYARIRSDVATVVAEREPVQWPR